MGSTAERWRVGSVLGTGSTCYCFNKINNRLTKWTVLLRRIELGTVMAAKVTLLPLPASIALLAGDTQVLYGGYCLQSVATEGGVVVVLLFPAACARHWHDAALVTDAGIISVLAPPVFFRVCLLQVLCLLFTDLRRY